MHQTILALGFNLCVTSTSDVASNEVLLFSSVYQQVLISTEQTPYPTILLVVVVPYPTHIFAMLVDNQRHC